MRADLLSLCCDGRCTGYTPLSPTHSGTTTRGAGPTETAWGKLDLSQPIYSLGNRTADANGTTQYVGMIPNSLAGRQLWLHSSMLWLDIRVLSNSLVLQF